MGKNLIVVESPAKARTITKYLGKDFVAMASYGHVRDLVPKSGAVNTENGFEMKYELIEKNKKHVDAITREMKKADALYLATDPDREGEAISWHIYQILKSRGALDGKPVHRVEFYEFTKQAIQNAVRSPRGLSQRLIDAQQARRALDYLVGFNLSPLLWKKVRRGLSAGRVQSPALRLICEREEEIERFKPREYWTIEADAGARDADFTAKLTYFEEKKLTQFSITTGGRAAEVREKLLAAARGRLVVKAVERKQRKRNPPPPFTTSTLQQEAARRLGFSAQRTMRIAQRLYEGVDVDGETVGLITYMRTDAVNLAAEAVREIRAVIKERFGAHNVPHTPHVHKNKSKNAQEAHEAIRPTSARYVPEDLKNVLDTDHLKLYELIWRRTLACQMIQATLDTVSVDLEAGAGNVFRASGSTLVDPGFMAVYREEAEDKKSGEKQMLLPPLSEGDTVDLREIRTEQHFTEPPPRYSEASLVKALESYGIGRPSTYATIISTLQQREYVIMKNRRFAPTDVGKIVNRFLSSHFAKYVDYDFTAKLEDDLDAISRGEKEWRPMLAKFWEEFKQEVEHKELNVDRKDVTQEALDETCPKCGAKLSIRLGRHGRFIGCTAYPKCDYTRNVDEEVGAEPQVIEGRRCPQCGSALIVKRGRYGKFIGCSAYPNCRHMEPLEKPQDTGVPCPHCGRGSMLKRRSRHGKVFYSCSGYPKCKYAVWNEPLAEPCPKCAHPILTLKTTKRRGTEKVCPQKECNYTERIADQAARA